MQIIYLALVLLSWSVAEAGKVPPKSSTAIIVKAEPEKGEKASPPEDIRSHPASDDAAKKGRDHEVNEALHKHLGFKMPKYHHVDAMSSATDGYLDWFVVIYWGALLLILATVEIVTHLNGGTPLTHLESSSDIEDKPSGPPPLLSTLKSTSVFGTEDDAHKEIALGENFWTLNLVSSLGQATNRRGDMLNPRLVFLGCVVMGLLQMFTLFLVVYDIDPSAIPYTVKPAAPWKTSPLTVNCMKAIMTFFLGMSVVAEAGDAYDNFAIGMSVREKKLLTARFNVLLAPFFHYLVTLSVILAGVSVILSCQAVPDILYNSMAILFITQVDELFWNFWKQTLEIEADWTVTIHEPDVPEAQLVKKCIILFPMLQGFSLLGRAWYRGQMPALIVRVLTGG